MELGDGHIAARIINFFFLFLCSKSAGVEVEKRNPSVMTSIRLRICPDYLGQSPNAGGPPGFPTWFWYLLEPVFSPVVFCPVSSSMQPRVCRAPSHLCLVCAAPQPGAAPHPRPSFFGFSCPSVPRSGVTIPREPPWGEWRGARLPLL